MRKRGQHLTGIRRVLKKKKKEKKNSREIQTHVISNRNIQRRKEDLFSDFAAMLDENMDV